MNREMYSSKKKNNKEKKLGTISARFSVSIFFFVKPEVIKE